jgi:hypothetical protein
MKFEVEEQFRKVLPALKVNYFLNNVLAFLAICDAVLVRVAVPPRS